MPIETKSTILAIAGRPNLPYLLHGSTKFSAQRYHTQLSIGIKLIKGLNLLQGVAQQRFWQLYTHFQF